MYNQTVKQKELVIFYLIVYIPGQHSVQETLIVFSPIHSLPPQLGLGWVHVRCWVITPSPQVAEHSVTFCHSLHPPSTKKVLKSITYYS